MGMDITKSARRLIMTSVATNTDMAVSSLTRWLTSGDATKSGKAAAAANDNRAQAILGSFYGFIANSNARSKTSPADSF